MQYKRIRSLDFLYHCLNEIFKNIKIQNPNKLVWDSWTI